MSTDTKNATSIPAWLAAQVNRIAAEWPRWAWRREGAADELIAALAPFGNATVQIAVTRVIRDNEDTSRFPPPVSAFVSACRNVEREAADERRERRLEVWREQRAMIAKARPWEARLYRAAFALPLGIPLPADFDPYVAIVREHGLRAGDHAGPAALEAAQLAYMNDTTTSEKKSLGT